MPRDYSIEPLPPGFLPWIEERQRRERGTYGTLLELELPVGPPPSERPERRETIIHPDDGVVDFEIPSGTIDERTYQL